MKNFFYFRFLIIFFCFFLASCVEDGSLARLQNITIITPGIEGASCKINGPHNIRAFVSKTPGNFSIRSGHGNLSVICSKKGYLDSVYSIKEIDRNSPGTGNFVEDLYGLFKDPMANPSKRYPRQIEIHMTEK